MTWIAQQVTSKHYAAADGTETQASFDLPVEIGLFSRSPADVDFDSTDVILLEKRSLQANQGKITLIVEKRPAYAGIDPYNKLIDRDSNDNLAPIM